MNCIQIFERISIRYAYFRRLKVLLPVPFFIAGMSLIPGIVLILDLLFRLDQHTNVPGFVIDATRFARFLNAVKIYFIDFLSLPRHL